MWRASGASCYKPSFRPSCSLSLVACRLEPQGGLMPLRSARPLPKGRLRRFQFPGFPADEYGLRSRSPILRELPDLTSRSVSLANCAPALSARRPHSGGRERDLSLRAYGAQSRTGVSHRIVIKSLPMTTKRYATMCDPRRAGYLQLRSSVRYTRDLCTKRSVSERTS